MRRCLQVAVTEALTVLLTVAGLAASAPVHAVGTRETYYLYVLNDPVPGREAEYNDWYDHQHAPDVVSIPGFVSARRYAWSEQQLRPDARAPTKYLIEFKIVTDDLAAVYAEVNRRLREHITVMSTAIAPGTGGSYTYRAITGVVPGKGGDVETANNGPKIKYIQMVFGTPLLGREREFNDWYNKVHAPSVAATPGFAQWQRFALSPVALGNHPAQVDPYMVRFEIETRDIAAVFATSMKGMPRGAPRPMNEPGRIGAGYTWRAIGPLLLGQDVRKERARHTQ